jgi:hypothetical protein
MLENRDRWEVWLNGKTISCLVIEFQAWGHPATACSTGLRIPAGFYHDTRACIQKVDFLTNLFSRLLNVL